MLEEPSTAEPLTLDLPFTAEELLTLLHSTVIKGENWVRPSQKALQHLATNLAGLQAAYEVYLFQWKEEERRAREAGDLICRFHDYMEFRADRCKAFLKESNASQASLKSDQREDIQHFSRNEESLHRKWDDFRFAFGETDLSPTMSVGPLLPRFEGWKSMAPKLASCFRAVMLSSNHLRLGLSNDGPVPRFVAAVIPRITGDTPSVMNVGKCLKDHARKTKRNGDGS